MSRRDPTALLGEASRLSQRFGRDPRFTRAGGGNSSVKVDQVLYIKPSGVSLATLTADTLMPLAMEPLLGLLEGAMVDPRPPGSETVMKTAMAARLRPRGDQRPSVECLFHALIPRRFVVHTHPTMVNALCCAHGGAAAAADLFGDTALWVPYVDPGLPLALAISAAGGHFQERTGAPPPDVILLQNHGLIVAADEASTIVETSMRVLEAIERHLDGRAGVASSSPAPTSGRRSVGDAGALTDILGPVLRASLSSDARLKVVTFDDSPDAVRLASTADGRRLVLGGPLTPDQIVYAGSWPLWLATPPEGGEQDIVEAARKALAAHIERVGENPTIIVVEGLGLFAAGATPGEAEIAAELYLDAGRVGFGALRLGGVRPLAPGERRFIEVWEAEAYRRGIAPSGGTPGPLSGRVILVARPAEGVGPALVAALRAGGAHVVPVESRPIGGTVHAAIRRYGGLDAAVLNRSGPGNEIATPAAPEAGILEAVARVFRLEHEARPDYRGAVIEVAPAGAGQYADHRAMTVANRRPLGPAFSSSAIRTDSVAEILGAIRHAFAESSAVDATAPAGSAR